MEPSELRQQPNPAVSERFVVALSLAEGETIRRLLHAHQPILEKAGLALRDAEGQLLDESRLFYEEGTCAAKVSAEPQSWSATRTPSTGQVGVAVQCLRFFNCEMYYTDEELDLLLAGLDHVPIQARQDFFMECLRLRTHERNLWIDTPIAKVFTHRENWHELRQRALLQQLQSAIVKKKTLDARAILGRYVSGTEQVLTTEQLHRALDAMQLGFSARDIADVCHFADQKRTGQLFVSDFVDLIGLPEYVPPEEKKAESKTVQTWQCNSCTFFNTVYESTCSMCDMSWTGQRVCPPGKWACAGELGGCTLFNPDSSFYCEVCNRARPDLASVRF